MNNWDTLCKRVKKELDKDEDFVYKVLLREAESVAEDADVDGLMDMLENRSMHYTLDDAKAWVNEDSVSIEDVFAWVQDED